MKVGDLVKNKEYEQYGIVKQILTFPSSRELYAVVFWQCGTSSGLYSGGLEVINANR
tara:strand:- start:555 stop:725 length:171 start_codon:yes stop_codon:yes gene_type:complete